MKKRLFLKSTAAIALLISLSIIFLISAFFVILQIANSEKIIYGLKIAGFQAGGLKLAAAQEALEKNIEDFKKQTIVLAYGEKEWQFSPAELGLELDPKATLNQALTFGKKSNRFPNNFFLGLKEQLQAVIFGKNIPVSASLNPAQFNAALINLASIENPAQNAQLTYSQREKSFSLLPESKGLVINQEELKSRLLQNAQQLNNQPLVLSLKEDQPNVIAKNLEKIKDQAEQLIEKSSFAIKSNDQAWPVEKQELAQWITTRPNSAILTLDENKIEDFLSQIAPAINIEPINARLAFSDKKIKVLAVSQKGKKLNIVASAKKIKEEILAGQTEIILAVDSIEPEISIEKIDTLGLTSLLGKGESDFAGSPKNRQYNIALGTSKMNGILIKPGEEFSFSQYIGEIEEKNGWLPELVIKNKKTIPEAGGGVCQVSTTLFRAAINSGLKITERYPHAYPVRYYNPQGFDATVYPPRPDLKFINDTPNYILFQAKIENTKLTFEIYGTSDGRETKVIGPKIIYVNPDGSMKTTLSQQIWRGGQMEREDFFPSLYRSPNLYPHPTTSPLPSPEPTQSPSPSPSNQ